jgi:hypothetical protein
MDKIRASYFVVVAIATILNGWALVHSLSVAPEHAGIIAAVLLTNSYGRLSSLARSQEDFALRLAGRRLDQ